MCSLFTQNFFFFWAIIWLPVFDMMMCEFATCVWLCEVHTLPACVHSRSHFLILRSDAGFSFERRAHNDISFRQHTSRHHGTAQRHFWRSGRRGSIMLDTFIGGVHAPPRSLIPSSFFSFFLGWCLYSRLLCLPGHLWLPLAPAPSPLSPLPLALPLTVTAVH